MKSLKKIIPFSLLNRSSIRESRNSPRRVSPDPPAGDPAFKFHFQGSSVESRQCHARRAPHKILKRHCVPLEEAGEDGKSRDGCLREQSGYVGLDRPSNTDYRDLVAISKSTCHGQTLAEFTLSKLRLSPREALLGASRGIPTVR